MPWLDGDDDGWLVAQVIRVEWAIAKDVDRFDSRPERGVGELLQNAVHSFSPDVHPIPHQEMRLFYWARPPGLASRAGFIISNKIGCPSLSFVRPNSLKSSRMLSTAEAQLVA